MKVVAAREEMSEQFLELSQSAFTADQAERGMNAMNCHTHWEASRAFR